MAQQTGASTVTPQTSAAVFIVLRKMRAPLILIIAIFGVTVLGMAVIPGDSPEGPWRMGLFNAFYFMSYTATTIGFGEIPHPFNTAQRLWVTFSIYITVIGWAYAFGSLLALLQQAPFKQALAVQRFSRRVRHLREPFWIVAGHGQAGEAVGVALDTLGRRFVAIDWSPERIDVVDLGSYTSDVPALVADARDPQMLMLAGMGHPWCAGLLALTDSDETNLAIVMAASVLRPELQVIARSSSQAATERMKSFGEPIVINPFDRFGDRLRVELRAPDAERLIRWLSMTPGTPLPPRHERLTAGAWIVCGDGRLGVELTADLRAAGIEVIPVGSGSRTDDPATVVGDATDPDFLHRLGIADCAGFAAGTDNDVTNLSLIAAARRANESIVVIGRQNEPRNASLFDAMRCDVLMVPGSIVAEEAMAYIGAPRLRMFVEALSTADPAVATSLLERLVAGVGDRSPDLWTVSVTSADAPALVRLMERTHVEVSDLARDPVNRHQWLAAVPVMVVRAEQPILAPEESFRLELDDVVLLAGDATARRSIDATLSADDSAAYVLTGERIGASWLWRTLTR